MSESPRGQIPTLLEGEAVLKALSLLQALSLSKCRSAEPQIHSLHRAHT